jgi:hypothetical protein
MGTGGEAVAPKAQASMPSAGAHSLLIACCLLQVGAGNARLWEGGSTQLGRANTEEQTTMEHAPPPPPRTSEQLPLPRLQLEHAPVLFIQQVPQRRHIQQRLCAAAAAGPRRRRSSGRGGGGGRERRQGRARAVRSGLLGRGQAGEAVKQAQSVLEGAAAAAQVLQERAAGEVRRRRRGAVAAQALRARTGRGARRRGL